MPTRTLLIVGGSGFIGPYFIDEALGQGLAVTVLNRGTNNCKLPDAVEFLAADRSVSVDILSSRKWDAVLDISAYKPQWVRDLCGTLKGNVEHYTFISSNAVYDHSRQIEGVTEESPKHEYRRGDPFKATSISTVEDYGALKLIAEAEVEAHYPGRALIVRPSWIFGPGSISAPLVFWPERFSRAGPVLAAGHPNYPVQFADPRDLARWLIASIKRKLGGIFTVAGPVQPTTLGDLITAARETAGSSSEVVWVDSAWLKARTGSDAFANLLFWTFESGGHAQRMRMDMSRARHHGFEQRAPRDTLSDTWAWYKKLGRDQTSSVPRLGISSMPLSWDDYLVSEGQAIAAALAD